MNLLYKSSYKLGKINDNNQHPKTRCLKRKPTPNQKKILFFNYPIDIISPLQRYKKMNALTSGEV